MIFARPASLCGYFPRAARILTARYGIANRTFDLP
jgi:hypothetical protein